MWYCLTILVLVILPSYVKNVKVSTADWFTINLTLPQKVLLLIAGIAYESETMLELWCGCYFPDRSQLNRSEYLKKNWMTGVRWCVGLTAIWWGFVSK